MSDAPKKPRSNTLELEWPLDLDGEMILSITLRSIVGSEVAALQEAMLAEGATDEAMIAAFADQPAEVIGQLDADDFMTLKEMVVDFLPRRIRAALQAAIQAEAEADS